MKTFAIFDKALKLFLVAVAISIIALMSALKNPTSTGMMLQSKTAMSLPGAITLVAIVAILGLIVLVTRKKR